MNIHIVCVGSLKSKPLSLLCNDYLSRLKRWVQIEVHEIKDGQHSDPAKRLGEEAEKIRKAIPKSAWVWLLCERGRQFNSEAFSQEIEKLQLQGKKEFCLCIGSSNGLEAKLRKDFPQHFSLSAMTMTHEWARSLLLEQIYRSFSILNNFPYHRD